MIIRAETRLDRGPSRSPRIVAIGASAGGIEPLEQFIEAMPAETDLAFVVIEHLSPDWTYLGLMPLH